MRKNLKQQGNVNISKSPFRFFMGYARHFRLRYFAAWLLFAMAIFAERFEYYLVSQIIDIISGVSAGDESVYQQALIYVFYIFLTICVGTVGWRVGGYLWSLLLVKLKIKIKEDLFEYTHAHSADYFARNLSGQIGHKVNQVADYSGTMMQNLGFQALETVFVLLFTLGFMAMVDWRIAAIMLVWALGTVGIILFFARRVSSRSEAYSERQTTVSGQILDTVTNALNVKTFANIGFERKRLLGFLRREYTAGQKQAVIIQWAEFIKTISVLIIILVLLSFSLYLWYQGQATTGQVVLIVTLMWDVCGFIYRLGWFLNLAFDSYGTIKNGLELIAQPTEIKDKAGARKLKVTKGKIEFNSVNFAYQNEVGVFKKLNVAIKPGQKVGLVGHSGSGKSTFVSLLMRFYDVQSGQIKIDDQALTDVTQNSIRDAIALIPQDTTLFHRTLIDNIRYGNLKATDDQVIAAAKKAFAHDFIMDLPEGYNALVGERGIKLSGGQRQRIAIARAILKDAPILILDEATSALDSESEKCIQKSLKTLMKNKTVIAIAHRLSTLRNLDRILVFKDSQIVEDGSHAQLLAKKGAYAHLWSLQSGDMLKN